MTELNLKILSYIENINEFQIKLEELLQSKDLDGIIETYKQFIELDKKILYSEYYEFKELDSLTVKESVKDDRKKLIEVINKFKSTLLSG